MSFIVNVTLAVRFGFVIYRIEFMSLAGYSFNYNDLFMGHKSFSIMPMDQQLMDIVHV